MEKKDQLVIVIGRNYSNGLAVARSLGAAGYVVDFIANAYKKNALSIVRNSKYIRKYRQVISAKVSEGESDTKLMRAIMKYADTEETKPILFTTDDYTTKVVDENRDILSEHFLMPSIVDGQQGDLIGLMDKYVQCGMAKEVGLRTPYTTLVSLREDEITIPEDVVYPCYVKPRKSIEGFKTEMAICENEEELMGHLMNMQVAFKDREVIVQEYLKVEQEYASAGTCFDQEVILPALIRKTSIGKHGRGVTLTGELVPVDSIGEDNFNKAVELLKKFRYKGNFGLEFIIANNGQVYFNEVNLRSAGEAYAYYKSGSNLPDIFASTLLGLREPGSEIEFNGIGKTIMYDKIAWEDYIYGFITKEELDRHIAETDIKILCDDDDPEPGEKFIKKSENARNRRDKRLNRCIEAAMPQMGWDREQAEKEIEAARERVKISYNDYLFYQFWAVAPEDQVNEYINIQRLEVDFPRTVVLSRDNILGLGVVRSLRADDKRIMYFGNGSKKRYANTTVSSKYVGRYRRIKSKADPTGTDPVICDALVERGEEQPIRRILLPADNYAAAVVDANRYTLNKYYYIPYIYGGKPGDLMKLMSKSLQREIAADEGLIVPRSWLMSAQEEIEIPDDIVYPCVCKPDNSVGTYKVHMRKCNNPDELLFAIRTIRTAYDREVDYIVEEYIEADSELSVPGVCRNNKFIIPATIRYTQMAKHNRGNPLTGVTETVDSIKEYQDSIERIIKRFHYFGPIEFEFYQVGEKLVFNEINFGFSKAVSALTASGINLPSIAARTIAGLPFFDDEEDDEDEDFFGTEKEFTQKTFASEPPIWAEYARKEINSQTRRALISSADVTLLDDPEDPRPYRYYVRRMKRIASKRRRRSTSEQIRKQIRPHLGDFARTIQGYPQGKKANQRDPESKDPRILVVGRNWCSNLCMAKALSQGGYEVEVLHVRQKRLKSTNIQRWLKPEKYSRHVKAYYICNSMRNSVRIVNRLVQLADKDRKMLLMPMDDLVGFAVDEYYDELKKYYILPSVNDQGGELTRMMSKAVQKELAREAGLPVVNSCTIDSSSGEVNIPDSVSYPCFIKPNVSKNSFKTRMMKCESKEELEEVLTKRLSVGFDMLVEDFIDIKREMSYLGISTPDGVVCPAYFEAVIEGVGSHRGVALLGRTLPAEDAEPLISQVAKFIESMNYTGLFDVDLVEDQDGTVYFVELNLRYGGSGFAFTKSGLNLPVMYADYMLHGTPLDMNCKAETTGKLFVNEKVLIDEYIESIIEFSEIRDAMKQAEIHFIKDEDDMGPYRHWRRNLPRARRLRGTLAEMQRRKEERIERRRLRREMQEIEALEAEEERQRLAMEGAEEEREREELEAADQE